jgi:asparagine synthase (glutamine-hydrolysing)
MCGIAGIVGRAAVRPEAVRHMNRLQKHRGPDDEGIWVSPDQRVVLGHTRLAVLDPSPRGHQPMTDASGRVTITFNGEIYNYLEIAGQLRAEGVHFEGESDTEVLLRGYLHWGESVLDELNGMFAFAIHDARTGALFCARDRFAEKPFLFTETGDYVAFASEYKALLALADVSAELDEDRLFSFLIEPRRGLDDDRQTVFSGVRQLLGGEKLLLETATLKSTISRYWSLRPNERTRDMTDDAVSEKFRDLLADSVRIRLRSDVEVGSCLSGGLDSSSIVCTAREWVEPDRPYHVFCGRFPGTSADEWLFAEQVATRTGATVHVTEPTPGDLLRSLDEFVWHNELPVGSTSQFAQWCVFKSAADHGVTVLLDGQGADEILGGYEQYFDVYLESLRKAGQSALAEEERRRICERYPDALTDRTGRWKRALPRDLRATVARVSGRGSDPAFGLNRAPHALTRTNPHGFEGGSPLTQALIEDTFVAHLPTLLRYGDRNSMAHSREVRLPFCDHRIAEFALGLSPARLMGDAQTKRLLRRAMAGVLPDGIVRRWNKQGFLPPQESWFRGELLTAVQETIHGRAFAERGWWNVAWWRGALDRFAGGEDHLAWTLWRPFFTEAWIDRFVAPMSAGERRTVLASD